MINNTLNSSENTSIITSNSSEDVLSQGVPNYNSGANTSESNLTLNSSIENKKIVNTVPSSGKAVTQVTTKPVVKSRKRTSLDEFAHRIRMRPEIKAGFKAWMKGQHFAFDKEWEQFFNNYNSRKI